MQRVKITTFPRPIVSVNVMVGTRMSVMVLVTLLSFHSARRHEVPDASA